MDIVFIYKFEGKFHGKYFYTQKKQYTINFYTVCNSNKQFIYTLTRFLNATNNLQIWEITQIYQNPSSYFVLDQYLFRDTTYTSNNFIILV